MVDVTYSPVELEHVPLFYRWFNDPDLTAHFYNSLPTNTAKVEALIRAEMAREYPLTFIQYADGAPIGFFRLHDLSFIHRKVELTLAVAEKAYQGRGYGKQLLHRALGYAYYQLNLEQVYLYVYKNNEPSIRLHESAGFVKEGDFRVLKYHQGQPLGGYRMALFRADYKG